MLDDAMGPSGFVEGIGSAWLPMIDRSANMVPWKTVFGRFSGANQIWFTWGILRHQGWEYMIEASWSIDSHDALLMRDDLATCKRRTFWDEGIRWKQVIHESWMRTVSSKRLFRCELCISSFPQRFSVMSWSVSDSWIKMYARVWLPWKWQLLWFSKFLIWPLVTWLASRTIYVPPLLSE